MNILTAPIPTNELDKLESFALDEVGHELRDVLFALSGAAREGAHFSRIDPVETLTPNQAASRLGMSRTHLYKLLDSGEIPFHRVGRDRRINVKDLIPFELQRQDGRRELAERFARRTETRNAAIDELINAM